MDIFRRSRPSWTGRALALLHAIALFPRSAFPAAALAGAPEPLSPAALTEMEIRPLVVMASRIGLDPGEIPQRLDVLEAADLERTQASDLADSLKRLLPLDIVQYPGLSGIGLRGMAPDFSGYTKSTALLVDGLPAGTATLSNLALDGVERVEILKGPASALYGSEAMGGVVNVVTRRPRGAPAGRLSVGVGSFGAWGASLSGGGRLGKRFDVCGGLSTDGHENDHLAGGRLEVPDSAVRGDNAWFSLGADLGDGWRAELGAEGGLGRFELSQDLASPFAVPDPGYLETARANGRLRVRRVGAKGDIGLAFYGADDRSAGQLYAGTSQGLRRYYRAYEGELSTFGGLAEGGWRFAGQDLRVGLEHRSITEFRRSWKPPATPDGEGEPAAPYNPDGSQSTESAFAQMGLAGFGKRITANLGGRFDLLTLSVRKTAYRDDVQASSTTLGSFNPGAGLQVRPWTWLLLHGSAGAAFTPPEASQLGLDAELYGVRYVGDPGLRPVTSRSVDAGVGLDLAPWGVKLDATAFWSVLEGSIVTRAVPGAATPTYTYVNLPGATELAGWELVASAGMDILGLPLWAHANFSHLEKARAAGTAAADPRSVNLMNVDPDKAVVGLVLGGDGALRLGCSGRFRGAVLDLDYDAPSYPYPEIRYPSVWIIDADVTLLTGPERSLRLCLSNLGDTYYYEKKGYPQPGRAFRIDYSVGF